MEDVGKCGEWVFGEGVVVVGGEDEFCEGVCRDCEDDG